MDTLRVTVIGAGAVGATLTAELVRRGASVTLIDASEVGAGTSSATFAWINSHNKSPAAYGQLNLLGLEAHERMARRGGRWFHQIGMMQVALSQAEADRYAQSVAGVTWPEYGARVISREEVSRLEPSIDQDSVVGGAFYPREGWLDVETMCISLVQESIERGARFEPFARVDEITNNTVRATRPNGEVLQVQSDVVVVAAGNGTPGVLRTLGINWPLIDPAAGEAQRASVGSSVGVISTTAPINSGITHFVRSDGIALRPARNGGITFSDHPTGGKWGHDDPRTWDVPHTLLARVKELYPSMQDAVLGRVSLGTRVLPSDGLTVADWVARDSSVYAITTHSGITLSAHLAESVAEELTTGHRHESLQPFGLDRFSEAPGVMAHTRP